MNKDQAKGRAKTAAGKLQAFAGKLLGSKKQEAKGVARQVAGRTRKAYGDGKQVARKTRAPARTTRTAH